MKALVKSKVDREVEALIAEALAGPRQVNYIHIEPVEAGLKLSTVVDGEVLSWIIFNKGEELDGLIEMLTLERSRLG